MQIPRQNFRGTSQCNILNGELRLKLLFLVIISHKKATNWTSNRIVEVKSKYIFEVETPPHHVICPAMRYLKAICLVQQSRNRTVFVSEWFIDSEHESYQGTAWNSPGKHVHQKYLDETVNLIPYQGNKRKLKCHTDRDNWIGRVRLGSIRNKNNWNNASKRLFGSYSHSGIPGLHSGYSAPRSRIAGIYSGIHSYSGIFPNERALSQTERILFQGNEAIFILACLF